MMLLYLWLEPHCSSASYDFTVLHITSNEVNMGWKPVLHAWKDYFAHLGKKRK